MSAELESLKDLARGLRRRVELSDSSDWLPARADVAPAPEAPEAALSVPAGASRAELFAALSKEIEACRACPLGARRLRSVPGAGSLEAAVMLIGEGPGFEEDHQGEPFVGPSGQLLDKILESIGLSRRAVYMTNIVKCRPMADPADPELTANDRKPNPDETEACRRWLDLQIRAIRPRFLVTLGAVPAAVLLNDDSPISKIRGVWRDYDPGGGAPKARLLPTFHPAALLRNPDLKRDVWADMKSLREELSKI